MKYEVELKRTSFIVYEVEADSPTYAGYLAMSLAESDYGKDALYEPMNTTELTTEGESK